jgi:hypothetical protein
MRLVMQNDIQQATMDTDVGVVVNEAQFSNFVHEKTHTGPRRADHDRLRQSCRGTQFALDGAVGITGAQRPSSIPKADAGFASQEAS